METYQTRDLVTHILAPIDTLEQKERNKVQISEVEVWSRL